VTEAQKEDFARVMEKMNSHYIFHNFFGLSAKLAKNVKERSEGKRKYDKYPSINSSVEVVQARLNSLDWILRSGCIVVPHPEERDDLHGQLSTLAFAFEEVWGALKKEQDLEKGMQDHWQILDLRFKKPWEK
jgi:hypothetical protein